MMCRFYPIGRTTNQPERRDAGLSDDTFMPPGFIRICSRVYISRPVKRRIYITQPHPWQRHVTTEQAEAGRLDVGGKS